MMDGGQPGAKHAFAVVLDMPPHQGGSLADLLASQSPREAGRTVGLGWDAVADLLLIRPTILVLDPSALSADQVAQLEGLRSALPTLRLVAYASDASEDLARLCLSRGYRGFLPQAAGPDRLAAALRIVGNGGLYLDRAFSAAVPEGGWPEVPALLRLSRREEVVLRRLAMGASRRAVAAELGVSLRAVDTYRTRGMRKLGLADPAGLMAPDAEPQAPGPAGISGRPGSRG